MAQRTLPDPSSVSVRQQKRRSLSQLFSSEWDRSIAGICSSLDHSSQTQLATYPDCFTAAAWPNLNAGTHYPLDHATLTVLLHHLSLYRHICLGCFERSPFSFFLQHQHPKKTACKSRYSCNIFTVAPRVTFWWGIWISILKCTRISMKT